MEAPAETPASFGDEHDEGGEPKSTSADIRPANDNLPPIEISVNNPHIEDATGTELSIEPELEAAKDNSPGEDHAATGTE